MNTFLQVIGLIISAGIGVTMWLFRKGGKYNPMPSLDNLPPEEPYIPASPVIIAPDAPKQPVQPVSTPKATLFNFALAIRDFEGKPGDQNWRLNNPGNARYNPNGYMPMYGEVGESPNGFAIFSSYAIGWTYLMNMLKGMIHKRPDNTILQFMQRYAPTSDSNNPLIYANFIAKRLSVDNSFVVKNLV